ncbi:MAG: hypothetical protein IPJ65_28500 [Archangiaceae bacterium]|nr:hypothetical protein [Archangiaceae bacterium]
MGRSVVMGAVMVAVLFTLLGGFGRRAQMACLNSGSNPLVIAVDVKCSGACRRICERSSVCGMGELATDAGLQSCLDMCSEIGAARSGPPELEPLPYEAHCRGFEEMVGECLGAASCQAYADCAFAFYAKRFDGGLAH